MWWWGRHPADPKREEVKCTEEAIVEVPKVEKEMMCHLRIQMRSGRTFEWWNTTWNGVAKKFYLWYSGRPESKHFIFKAKDQEGSTTTCIIRSEIVAFETYWKLKEKK